jgi:hypothetical protein
MERLIVLPEKDSPVINSDSINSLENGIIIVYENDNIIGSVVEDNNSDEFLLNTFYDAVYYSNVTEILENNPNLTFKYITRS